MNELSDFSERAEAAILAAAIGDALGWPHEDRAGRVGGPRKVEPHLGFREWRRRAGGRYASHEVVIGAGEYSDDTQLITAVARSLLAAKEHWWTHWTQIELPFWLLYERGGGGATKRAAKGWARGKPPWLGETAEQYFSAGGNGVAMRVLPHCLRHEDFALVSRAIVEDGIATHGHPRSLVGALAFGYTLWQALRRRDRLPYGALIHQTLTDLPQWAPRPAVSNIAPDWEDAANQISQGQYAKAWDQTVVEMTNLLRISADAIAEGSLAVDRETLERLGSFHKQVSGAGTVTAAAAIFLASRHASRPVQGLSTAAFAQGADTDTMASMTASLLAAVNGGDWLGGMRDSVQDDRYLARLGQDLLSGREHQYTPLAASSTRQLLQRLSESDVGAEIPLPDSRVARLRDVVHHPTKTRNEIKTFVLETNDGQTLFLKRVRRKQATASSSTPASDPNGIGLVLRVEDLQRSLAFWRDIAGLPVSVTDVGATIGDRIDLVEDSSKDSTHALKFEFANEEVLRSPNQSIIILVAGPELEGIHRRMRSASLPLLVTAGPRGGEGVRCIDPDGNVVEFRQTAVT